MLPPGHSPPGFDHLGPGLQDCYINLKGIPPLEQSLVLPAHAAHLDFNLAWARCTCRFPRSRERPRPCPPVGSSMLAHP